MVDRPNEIKILRLKFMPSLTIYMRSTTEVKLVTFMKVSHSYIVSNFVHSSATKTSRSTPENYLTVEFLLLHSDQYPARFFTVSI